MEGNEGNVNEFLFSSNYRTPKKKEEKSPKIEFISKHKIKNIKNMTPSWTIFDDFLSFDFCFRKDKKLYAFSVSKRNPIIAINEETSILIEALGVIKNMENRSVFPSLVWEKYGKTFCYDGENIRIKLVTKQVFPMP